MKISFKAKLIFSYFFVVLISFSFVAFFLDRNLEDNSLKEIKSSLLNQASLVAGQITTPALLFANSAALDRFSKDISAKIQSRITIIGLDGKVLADSGVPFAKLSSLENHLNRPEVVQALNDQVGQQIRYSSTLKIDMLYLAVPIKEDNLNRGILRLALPLTSVQKVLFAVRRTIILGLFFSLGLAFVLGSVLAQAVIHPINRIIQASLKFAQGDFSRRIFSSSKDEIGILAATLNNMAQDIEEKIREIATQSQRLKVIFNSMIEGVIVTDSNSRIISINQAIEGLFGISKSTTEGKFFLEGIRNSDISEVITRVVRSAQFVSREITLVMPIQKILEVNVSPVFEKDEVIGTVAVIHDITQIRRLETMRQDFVANVSHELKTPLTSIKGFVETLLEGALEDKENNLNFLKIIDTHVDRLNALINDLLDLSTIESKDVVLAKDKFNLAVLTEEVVTGFKSLAKTKGIKLFYELPAETQIVADKSKIEQVFANLINNAIKYNKDNGSVRIYLEESQEKLKVIVEDSGCGIPVKDLPRIFERFYRVDKARSRELGGTGLGLSIVKHIIELHGGSVGVESTEGFGSKFWFMLPK